MAVNRIHYKLESSKMDSDNENAEWKIVTNRKNRIHKKKEMTTTFVAKIPIQAKARDILDFFKNAGRVIDIVLPRKRGKTTKELASSK